MLNKMLVQITSNHVLHEVIIMEAIQEYMEDRGFFCHVKVERIDKEKDNAK